MDNNILLDNMYKPKPKNHSISYNPLSGGTLFANRSMRPLLVSAALGHPFL